MHESLKFEQRVPSVQNAIDIFRGKWMSDLRHVIDVDSGGSTDFTYDQRPAQAAEALGLGGRFDGFRILELGPLEGGHSWQLEQLGAREVVAIEANIDNYLKCLVVKEALDLRRSHFLLGDFCEYLRETDERFDLVFACGVLYHMAEPLELIESIARVTDRCYIWTHYFDPEAPGRLARTAKLDSHSPGVIRYEARYPNQDYDLFLGAGTATNVWLRRADILAAFERGGLGHIQVIAEDTEHPEGASFSFAASRTALGTAEDGRPDSKAGGADGDNHTELYRRHLSHLLETAGDSSVAHEEAIGGDFVAMGAMQRDLLVWQGLEPTGYVVDVGCGSGRLALPLSEYLSGPYLGTDVVPGLLEYASQLVQRPDWRFELINDIVIPAADGSADIVCFFSVLTHLRHEESYRYLEEARRVVKNDGKIIFSFLEFAVPSHWAIFAGDLATFGTDRPVDQFMDRDAIRSWSDHIGLEVLEILSGDEPNIPLKEPLTMASGIVYESFGALGQSVAILSKRAE